MKWVRAPFTGKKRDGTTIEYTGYVSGPFGICRGGRRSRYYDLIHVPSGVSLRPRSLWLPNLADAKAYGEEVYALQEPGFWATEYLTVGTADGIVAIANRYGRAIEARERAKIV